MARHRNIRNRNYSYDEEDDYSDYSEEECHSPNSRQFVYDRDSPTPNVVFTFLDSNVNVNSNVNNDESVILTEEFSDVVVNNDARNIVVYYEQVVDILGKDAFSDEIVYDVLLQCQYDVAQTIQFLLEGIPVNETSIPGRNKDDTKQQHVPVSSGKAKVAAIGGGVAKVAAIGGPAVVAAIGGGPAAAAPSSRPTIADKTTSPVEKQVNVETLTLDETKGSEVVPNEIKIFLARELDAQKKCSLERTLQEKEPCSMVVIGHVDAGKSTLMGHVLVQMGYVPPRQMHKYEKEAKEVGKASFAFAWVLDADEEERTRGVTMDVGLTHFTTGTQVFR